MVVIVGRAEPTIKLINGEEKSVTPFFGMDREGDLAQMSVGYVTDDGTVSMWGLMAPTLLITSWRAMRILSHLKSVERFTLSQCWYAASGRQSQDGANAIEKLSNQFADHEVLVELLVANPGAEELDGMLRFVMERGIDVNVYELRDLIERGLIEEHPIILELEAKQQKASDRYEARERFIAAPMQEQDSLGSFFTLLGIDNLLDGAPFGGYGVDWGHIKIGDLDSMIKQTSTGEYASSFTLRHTTKSPETRKTPLGRGGSMLLETSFGEIETPYFVDYTGTKYTFLNAKYRYDEIVVTVQIDEKERDMTVAQLREMIVVKKPKNRWLRRR